MYEEYRFTHVETCSLLECTNVTEGHAASIVHSEAEGSTYLQTLCNVLVGFTT